MNSEKLSNRLATVVKYIPKGFKIADIGSDHAYLPCHVVAQGLVPFAIAGEVVEGPFQSAKKQVALEGLTEKISVRMGSGLEVISPNEVDCITIAGMGGALIASILDEGKDKLGSVQRLILQPNLSAKSIRTWLIDHHWELVGEEILEEDDKIYEVLIAEKGDPLAPYSNETLESDLLFGPFLKKQKSETFTKKWLNEKKNWERILQQIETASNQGENNPKREELLNKIKMVEEVLN
ncbi:tRNA (adenine(22)-N(1))-methyltransferase TrmK (plasmid) [Bacillus sp. 31A1R]|uniref:tRNA (Adenine(22)-N(1))-methyltransferase TrmK n=1 Tax=Robertmurraya mangrovi TaxID=3098077 RepID=A0ABU5IUY5_9BACI|nr:tRNA (adenine(22)-N(1))-methyltransferase TrmK [Bacillus sp. 31A1R]MDZ5470961.1 tRNA (adenine(22)-N(1))-methyltransferase TrmK [Bacillus sp. 31A1R]